MATNTQLFDRYTAYHLASGAALGCLNTPWWAALGLAVAWEAAEPSLKRSRFWRQRFPDPTLDSLGNKTGDVAALMAAWYVAQRRVSQ